MNQNDKDILMQLVNEHSLGEVLDDLQELAFARSVQLRDRDKETAVIWSTASVGIQKTAHFALNCGI